MQLNWRRSQQSDSSSLSGTSGLPHLVVERRAATGGTATTAMFHPGYSADTVQHDAGLLRQRIIDDPHN